MSDIETRMKQISLLKTRFEEVDRLLEGLIGRRAHIVKLNHEKTHLEICTACLGAMPMLARDLANELDDIVSQVAAMEAKDNGATS
jgi:hypothetical protein